MNRFDYLKQQFKDTYDSDPEEMFDHEIDERDLEIALRLKKDKLTGIALSINAEQTLDEMDEKQLSEESRSDIKSTRAKLRFNKKVACARYGKPWSEIKDLFLTGQYEELEKNYSEDWDITDLEEYEDKI